LLGEAKRPDQRNLEELILDLGAGMRELNGNAVHDDRVETELVLRGAFGLERSVAERLLHQRAGIGEREGLILVGETGASAGGSAREAQLEFAELRETPPRFLRQTPCTAHAVVRVPALVRPEE
jgi:hypothetical protein